MEMEWFFMKLYVTDKWKIIKYTTIMFAICFVFTIANNMSLDVIATIAGNKLIPIYNIQTEEKVLSLTFDCAWGAEDMSDILTTLKNENVKATFFVLGEWAEKYPDVIKQMVADGHDVANHSDTHPHTNELNYDEVKNEIINANNKIKNITGKENKLFRAPYGEYNNTVIQAAMDTNNKTIQWSIDSLDWQGLTGEQMWERIR
jgi:peptidoglycan/xylan/chitin deacetylase (PgdA/CDA1 family)